MADGYIDIGIRLDDSQAKSQAQGVGNEIGSAIDAAVSKTSTSTSQAIGNIGTAMAGFGTAYSKAVTIPILAAATASGAAAVKIDTALTGVRKTVDGTEEQYEALKDAAVEFSKTNAVDPAQILDIQALGAQLGFAIDELDEFGQVVSGLDIATNMDAETAAMELAQFANIMGMSHDEVRNYGSAIVDLGNHFATTESDISSMAMRIAGAGRQIGLSEADVLGLATALSSMGINAEAGGTAISTIMSSIDKDVALGTERLSTWAETANMSVDEFARAWGEDAVGALSAVLVGMDDATQEGGNMAVMLDELGISSIRQTDTLKRLASNSEFLGEAVSTANQAWAENTALDKEVENRNNSLAAQFEILKNKVMAVALEVGEPLMEALIDVIDAAEPLIEALASGAKAFGDLDEGAQRTVLAAVGAVAAFGPLVGVTGKLLTTVTSGASAWKAFKANVDVVRSALTSTSSGMGAFTKYAQTASGAVVKWDSATQFYVKTNSTMAKALATTKAGMAAQAAATNVSTVAMKAASVAARTLKTALLTIAPVAVFTVLVEVVSAIAGAMSDAADEAEGYEEATRGLEAAAMGTASAISEEAKAIERVDLEGMREAHSDLAKSIAEVGESAQGSVAVLEGYRDTIARLADNSDLTDAQVAELRVAVDGLNSELGTSYEVAQDADGAWRVMADGAVVAADAIDALIDAQERQIRMEALKEQYKAVYQQLAQDAEDYAEASQNVADAQQALNDKLADLDAQGVGRYYADASGGIHDFARAEQEALDQYQSDLADVEGQMGATQSAANRLKEQMTLNAMATDEGASALLRYIDGDVKLKAAIQTTGTSLTDFATYLQDAGVSVEQLRGIMETEGAAGIEGFANAYKAGGAELEAWASSHGINLSTNIGTGIAEGQPQAVGAANEADQALMDAFAGLPDALGTTGKASMASMGSGISDGKGTPIAESQVAAGQIGAPLEGLQYQSSTWGSHLLSNFASGIGAKVGEAVSAAASAAERIAAQLRFSVPKEGPFSGAERGGERSGEHLIENFARGMRRATPDAVAEAVAAAEAIKEPFEGLGEQLADCVVLGFDASDPMRQVSASIERGMAAVNVSAAVGGVSPSYVTNTQNNTFTSPITSPDQVARQLRLQQLYTFASER